MSGPSDAPRVRGGARLTVVLLVVTILFTGLGLLAGWGMVRRYGTEDCSANLCLAQVNPPKISDALVGHGFTCRAEGPSLNCELRLKHRRYDVDTTSGMDGKPPTRLRALVIRTGPGPVDGELALLSWVASLPVADDPDATKQVTTWLRQKAAGLEDGGSSTARIGGIVYTLELDDRELGTTGGYSLDIHKDVR